MWLVSGGVVIGCWFCCVRVLAVVVFGYRRRFRSVKLTLVSD